MAKSGELGSESVSEYPWWNPDKKSTEISFTKRDDMDNNGFTITTQQRGLITGLLEHEDSEVEDLKRKNGKVYEVTARLPISCLRITADSGGDSSSDIIPYSSRDY